MGLTTLKFFPAEASGSINMVKSLLAPLHGCEIMPTGGISKQHQRLPSDTSVLACGEHLDGRLIEEGNWEELAHLTREAVKLVN